MARLPDKSKNEKDGQEIAKYLMTHEILLQYIDAKIELEGSMPKNLWHLDLHEARDGEGPDESSSGEVHELEHGFGSKGGGLGG